MSTAVNLVFRFDPMTKSNSEYPSELFDGLAKVYETLPVGFTVKIGELYHPMSADEFSASLQIALQHIFFDVALNWHEVSISDEAISDADWKKQIDDFKKPFNSLPSTCKDIGKLKMHYCKASGDDFYNVVRFNDIFSELPKSSIKIINAMIKTFRELVIHKPIMAEIDRVFEVLDKVRKRPDLG